MLRLFFLVAAMLGCVWLSGCDFPEIKRPPATGVGGLDPDMGATVSGGGTSNTDSSVAQPLVAPPPPPENRSTMQTGASQFQKGQYGRTGIYSTSVSAYFRARESISIELIKKNMDLYKAYNGRAPQTHEEFMKVIIDDGKITLPMLKEDCRYEYNPEKEELEIVYPL